MHHRWSMFTMANCSNLGRVLWKCENVSPSSRQGAGLVSACPHPHLHQLDTFIQGTKCTMIRNDLACGQCYDYLYCLQYQQKHHGIQNGPKGLLQVQVESYLLYMDQRVLGIPCLSVVIRRRWRKKSQRSSKAWRAGPVRNG